MYDEGTFEDYAGIRDGAFHGRRVRDAFDAESSGPRGWRVSRPPVGVPSFVVLATYLLPSKDNGYGIHVTCFADQSAHHHAKH